MSTLFFFFNDTATTEIYTLSLHDALPIWSRMARATSVKTAVALQGAAKPSWRDVSLSFVLSLRVKRRLRTDRKSTRLNSSHDQISYAVFCLKKKKKK